jgi:hypothetical protein
VAEKRTVFLRTPRARQTAHTYIDQSPDGWMMTLQPETKRRVQEEKYHAMIGDIARQIEHLGRRWDADDMKRLLVDDFAEVMREAGTPLHHDSRVTPSLDGRRIVQLGIQTREFWVPEAAAFIEYLYALGADRGVEWTEPEAAVPA